MHSFSASDRVWMAHDNVAGGGLSVPSSPLLSGDNVTQEIWVALLLQNDKTLRDVFLSGWVHEWIVGIKKFPVISRGV
jgi:hypothetical protein